MALDINCGGTRNLVKIANEFGIKVFLASTCSLYGAESCSIERPLTEDSRLYPVDIYALTKHQQERIVLENAENNMVFRLGTVYGLSPERMRFDLVINQFAVKAAKGEILQVFGGEQYRPFVHVKDVARAFIFALERNLGGLYNLSQVNITIKELAERFNDQFKTGYEVNSGIQDPRNYIVSSEKLLSKGFKFEGNFRYHVREMMDFADTVLTTNPAYYNVQLMRNLR
jgi:nucleoside-diphosphate-sugar epimerase